MAPSIDDDVREYVDGIAAQHRPLFDRVHGLLLEEVPDVAVELSYKMPTYRSGDRGLHVAVWKHGLSIYGWDHERDGGFSRRHPELAGEKGTIRLSAAAAATIEDDELRAFLRATFAP